MRATLAFNGLISHLRKAVSLRIHERDIPRILRICDASRQNSSKKCENYENIYLDILFCAQHTSLSQAKIARLFLMKLNNCDLIDVNCWL